LGEERTQKEMRVEKRGGEILGSVLGQRGTDKVKRFLVG
jgi:hypothetical protein